MNSQKLNHHVYWISLIFLQACAQMGSLRPAWEDDIAQEPTTGGRYASGGLLEEELARDRKVLRNHRRDQEQPYAAGEAPLSATRSGPKNDPTQERAKSRRLSRKDFIDDSASDGSLWDSDGQTNYFLTKNKVRNTGDFVTILSDPELVRDFAYEIKRTLSEDERDDELSLARSKPRASPATATAGAEAKDKPATEGEAVAEAQRLEGGDKNVRWSEVDLRDAIEFKAGDPVIAEVVSRSGNGTYRLEGVKRIRYRSSYRTLQLSAIVKQSDISETDEVPAQKLFEYRLESLQ